MAMTNEQYEVILQAKYMMEQNGVFGVQFMEIENDYAIFEAIASQVGRRKYVNYRVSLYDAIERGYFLIERVNVTVENHSESDEIDVTVNTWTYDEDMTELEFEDELVRTYKRESSA